MRSVQRRVLQATRRQLLLPCLSQWKHFSSRQHARVRVQVRCRIQQRHRRPSLHRLSRWHLHQLLERDCVRLVRGGDLLELWWKQCLRRVSDWRFYGRGCGNYHFGLQVRRRIHWTV